MNSQLKWVVAGIFLPFLGLAAAADEGVESLQSMVVSKQDLLRENQRLRREIQSYKITLLQNQAIASENVLLRQELEWREHQPWRLLPARVLIKDPTNWWRSFYINLGSEDGVVENAPVLSPLGLVGKVEQVETHRSLVRLVGDPHCKVAAMLSDTLQQGKGDPAHGTIMPGADTALNPGLVDFQHLPAGTAPEPGAKVITSGLGGGYPRGIPVGHIVDSRSSTSGLFAEARVRLAVDLNRLEMVWVKLPDQDNPATQGGQ
ncbi:MAG: rod shape-determining protein MreC [Verrucomicrobia bacterium]|nr:rod shape-determining protein MreC [Verrucomicrobiota bacterium]